MNTEEINAINKHCYDNQADRWRRFPFQDFLPEWVEKYHSPELGRRLLEIGSGVGTFALWMAQEGFDVLCLDPSDEMARRCCEKGLLTIQTTFQEYEGKGPFDIITAICSLVHVPKSEFPAQIAKVAALLSSKGTFILAMIEGESEGLREEETGYPRFFATYTKEEILAITSPFFTLLDFRTVDRGGGLRYLVFALRHSSLPLLIDP